MKILKHDFEITPEMKLPEPFKTNWLKDLRSGEYKQGQNRLLKDNRYCCLGVACKTAGYSDKRLKYKNGSYSTAIFSDSGSFIKMRKVPAQLQGSCKNRTEDVVSDFLALNNDLGYTHKQIADWVEKYL